MKHLAILLCCALSGCGYASNDSEWKATATRCVKDYRKSVRLTGKAINTAEQWKKRYDRLKEGK